jgi:hypothetical protein
VTVSFVNPRQPTRQLQAHAHQARGLHDDTRLSDEFGVRESDSRDEENKRAP